MAPDRKKTWAGTWNDRLAPCQDLLLAATLVAALCLALFFAYQSAGLFVSLPGAGGEEPAGVLAFDGEIRETEFPETRYRAAAEGKEPVAGAEGTPALPKIDWADRELRRQAASLVSRSGDYPGAVELLAAGDPDRAELLKVPALHHRELLAALEELLPLEVERLGQPRGAPIPEGLLFSFVTNLHCALRDRTGACDAHLKLVLESCFPPHSPSRKLYRETRNLRPVPYHEPQRP